MPVGVTGNIFFSRAYSLTQSVSFLTSFKPLLVKEIGIEFDRLIAVNAQRKLQAQGLEEVDFDSFDDDGFIDMTSKP